MRKNVAINARTFLIKKKKKKWMAFLHSKHASTHFIINISYEKHYQKCYEIFYSEWFFFIARGFHLMVFFHFTTDKKQICLNPSLISSTGSFIYFYFFFWDAQEKVLKYFFFFFAGSPIHTKDNIFKWFAVLECFTNLHKICKQRKYYIYMGLLEIILDSWILGENKNFKLYFYSELTFT